MANRKYDLDKYLHGKNHHKRKGNPAPRRAYMSGIPGDDSNFKMVDLHHLALHLAQQRIKDEIRDMLSDGLPGVEFIHGSTHGTRIQDWMRDGSLEQSIDSLNLNAKVWFNRDGVTCVEPTR